MSFELRLLEDLGDIEGATVFSRVDFNVPLEGGEVADDTRLAQSLPTVRELCQRGARLLLASHCGRPKGERNPAFSLRPAARRLAELLDQPISFAEDCIGEPVARSLAELAPGQACLLENLRYHPGETANDDTFADALAATADIFVNDAFGTAHRAHASVVGVAGRLDRKAAGHLLVREVEALGRLLGEPERPFTAVVGGAKIGSKIGTVENLLPRLDRLLLGGGMANTFLAARGADLGDSLVEHDKLDVARRILELAEEHGVQVLLPVDLVITDSFDAPQVIETVAADSLPAGRLALDVGEETRERFAAAVADSRTLLWNGPLGVFEKPPFDAGTVALAKALADCPGFTVIGGGETVAAARRAGVTDRIGHVSTGGGASLELLAGKALPGITALQGSPR